MDLGLNTDKLLNSGHFTSKIISFLTYNMWMMMMIMPTFENCCETGHNTYKELSTVLSTMLNKL